MKRSNWWYVLPILFSILGGIIAYFAIRYDDAKKARNCLILGTILFVIPFLIPILIMWSLGSTEFVYSSEDTFFEFRQKIMRGFSGDYQV